MLTILCLLLGVSPSDLGARRFHDREDATARMVATWPLSFPLLLAGTQHDDPEVRWRSESILRRLTPRLVALRGLADPDVRALLTECPNDARLRMFGEVNKFTAMMDAALALGLVNKGHDHIPDNSQGIAWILACRAEAVRRGKDPELTSTSPPTLEWETVDKGGRVWGRWKKK